jgi:hypothetical protein
MRKRALRYGDRPLKRDGVIREELRLTSQDPFDQAFGKKELVPRRGDSVGINFGQSCGEGSELRFHIGTQFSHESWLEEPWRPCRRAYLFKECLLCWIEYRVGHRGYSVSSA